MDTSSIEQTLIDYIESTGRGSVEKGKLGLDEALIDKGLLDSVGVLQLVVFIEEKFDVTIEDDEVVPENFETVRTIGRYVRQKLGTVK